MNILITGGSSDIAYAIAQRRLKEGDNVIITCSTEESLTKTLTIYHANHLPVKGIVYNFSQPELSIESIKHATNNKLDAVILNAFTRLRYLRKYHELPLTALNTYITENIQGNLWLIHHLLPQMLEQQFGRLVLMSSISASNGTSGYSPYCIAKAALEGLFFNLAIDYSALNILSNIVRMGIFKTSRTKHFWKNPLYQEKMSTIIPQGCLGEPYQVAEVLDPLLSPTSYLTGSIITVSGGLPLVKLS